ncbi:MAG: ABC transporter substrate-binding protein [Lachnospiraceae bacterium]
MRKRQMLTWITAVTLGMSLLSGCSKSSGQAENTTTAGSAVSSSVEMKTSETSGNNDLKVVREAVMSNNLDQWLAIIGTEKGFFEDEGIKLEVTEFAAGINTVDAIVTGQADIGVLADYAAVNRIGNTQDKTNLRILFRLAQGAGNSLYVNPDKVKDLSDLAGRVS